MNFIQSVVIAIIEGLTEFLPISSTAHMKFAQRLMGINTGAFESMFEIVIQLAAILAVVVLYYRRFFSGTIVKFYSKLVVAVIPAVIAGLFLKKYIYAAIDDLYFISLVMVGGGFLLLFIEKFFFQYRVSRSEKKVTMQTAFIIGCGQVLSIIFPGLSRSAATILTGMSQGLSRGKAAEFSFFLAVPTMTAASVKTLYDTYTTTPQVLHFNNLAMLLTGSVISFFVAMLSIRFFLKSLKKHGFRAWGVYRIIVGSIMLLLLWKGVVK